MRTVQSSEDRLRQRLRDLGFDIAKYTGQAQEDVWWWAVSVAERSMKVQFLDAYNAISSSPEARLFLYECLSELVVGAEVQDPRAQHFLDLVDRIYQTGRHAGERAAHGDVQPETVFLDRSAGALKDLADAGVVQKMADFDRVTASFQPWLSVLSTYASTGQPAVVRVTSAAEVSSLQESKNVGDSPLKALLSSAVNNSAGTCLFWADLYSPDDQLQTEFKRLVDLCRKERSINPRRETGHPSISRSELLGWHRSRVLAYFDLLILCRSRDIKASKADIAAVLFPEPGPEASPLSMFETTENHYRKLIDPSILALLMHQATADRDAPEKRKRPDRSRRDE